LGEKYLADKDYKKSFEYFLKSAQLGLSLAQIQVGACFENGLGVAKDERKAFE
jgi:TPR repeat protein